MKPTNRDEFSTYGPRKSLTHLYHSHELDEFHLHNEFVRDSSRTYLGKLLLMWTVNLVSPSTDNVALFEIHVSEEEKIHQNCKLNKVTDKERVRENRQDEVLRKQTTNKMSSLASYMMKYCQEPHKKAKKNKKLSNRNGLPCRPCDISHACTCCHLFDW